MGIDFHLVAREFPGRLYEVDCRQYCQGPHRCCSQPQWHPLAPGEGAFLADHGVKVAYSADLGCDTFPCEGKQDCPGKLRPIVCRTYPIRPGGKGLEIDTACSEHPWVSWDFIMQMEKMWRYLFGADPGVILWVSRLREYAWDNEKGIPVYEVERHFGSAYTDRLGIKFRADLRAAMLGTGWIALGDRVLDAGGGKGDGVALLREQGIDAVNLDVNPVLIKEGGGVVGDVRDIPFDSGSFDVVFCFDVLEHLDDPGMAVREMLRVSRDRVIVYVTTLEQENNLFLDITHRVFWPFAKWLELFSREAEIVDVDWCHTGALLRRRVNAEG